MPGTGFRMPFVRRKQPSAKRARHVRTMALALIFITAQVAIILFAGIALEGVNATRSYATGEAQWSKAQKHAVISLMHYAGSRDARDLAQYHDAMTVIAGDTEARLALEKTPPDMDAATHGFLAGLNAEPDVWGLRWGFLLLHRWEPFALAVDDWRRADGLTARLSYLSGSLRGAIEAGAPLDRVRAILADISKLDRAFSVNEYKFSVHMGEASRTAKSLTLLAMEIASLFVCLIVGVMVRSIAEASAATENRAKENETRMRDYVEIASDWFCELDRDLDVTQISPRFLRLVSADEDDIVGLPWFLLKADFGLTPLSEDHRETLARRVAFREHLFRHETGGPVFFWSISGKPLFDGAGAFAGYRVTAMDITRFRSGFAASLPDNLNGPREGVEAVAEAPEKIAAVG